MSVRQSIFSVINVVNNVYVVFQILGNCIVVLRHQPSPLELTGTPTDNVSDAMDRFELVELCSAKVQIEPFGHFASYQRHSLIYFIEFVPAVP